MTAGPQTRKVVVPQLLHVGDGCLEDVASLLGGHGFDLTRVLVGTGPGPSRLLAATVVAALRRAGAGVIELPGLEGRLQQAAAAAATMIEEDVTLAIAVGGGRVIDTVKLAAARTRTELVTVPTTISNDGISSPVASLICRDGSRRSCPAAMPGGIVVDLGVVASAPPRTLRAGVGDLVSNLTAGLDWRLADRMGHERYDAFAAMIAETAARPALDLVELESESSREVLARGLLLSGLAMATAGTSRPCSGAEHLVSHALDAALGERAAMHGEQVALGSLISAAAHRSPLLPALHRMFGRVGLPVRPADLGLDDEEVLDAARRAAGTRPVRYTVLSDQAVDLEDVVTRAFAAPARPAAHAASIAPATRS